MVALVGRRRVGKTYLVREVYKGRINFELTGIQHAKKVSQLQNFVLTLEKYFPAFVLKEQPTTWLKAFHELTRALETIPNDQKQVVFLDELPWLGSPKSGFIEGLSYFWNSWASKQNIVVVICGSAASWMIKKVIQDKGGLHNRVTRLLYLFPFTLAETEAYCKYKGIKWNRYLLLQIYMTMGGIPMYLDQLKSGLSAIQNIQEICFEPTGYLYNEFGRLYASLFKNHENHISIIRTLASKRKGLTRMEIIKFSKFSNGGKLTETLEELEKSGFITVYGGYGKKVKQSLYRLTDFFSLFYLTYIEPLGKTTSFDFTSLSDLPNWRIWGGYAYENVSLIHIKQIKKALSIAGMASSMATFVASPKDGLPGTQIDLLIDRSDQTMNMCEIKFSISTYDVSKKDTENFTRKKQVFQYHTKTKKHLFTTLITTFGAIENQNKINYVDQVVSMDDLFVD